MNLKDLIRADKTGLETGTWASGHIPRTAFPMSKVRDRKYKYGPEYRWRLIKFVAEGLKCRILLQLNEGKEILRARFGVEVNGDMVVLCTHEFHASEPGWHCHVTFDEIAAVPPGAARSGKKKWPVVLKPSARFNATEASALTIVSDVFQLRAQGAFL